MKTKLLAVLFASLTVTPLAQAQEPRPAGGAADTAEPRHRLVGVILSTSQALLWDDDSGEYQLRRVGDELYGGQIVAMEEDVVIVERGETREEIGISAPPQRKVAARRSRRLPAMIIQVGPGPEGQGQALAPVAPQPAPQAPAQPPAPAPPQPQAPSQPQAPPPAGLPALPQPAPQAPVFAPAQPEGAQPPAYAPPGPQAPAPGYAPPAAAPAPTYAPPAPGPTYAPPAPAPQPASQADPRGVMPLSRAQLERELGTMGGPQQPVVLTANPQGGFRIAALRAGSLAEAIGLRAGDVVLRIDGRPINGLGDAASAYAWLRLTEQFTLDVLREGRVVTLRYAFTA